MADSIAVAFPLGVMSGIYVSEYARDNWLVRVIRVMTSNLSGVPSIVFGLFGMALFVRTLGFGDSIIAGSLTLALLVLPIVIRTTEEAIRSIDNSLRNGSYALGATKLQTVWRVLLPMAFPNIVTGLILSIGRVSGEDGAHSVHGRRLFPAETARQYFRSGHGPALSPVRDRNERNGYLEASRPMAYGTGPRADRDRIADQSAGKRTETLFRPQSENELTKPYRHDQHKLRKTSTSITAASTR